MVKTALMIAAVLMISGCSRHQINLSPAPDINNTQAYSLQQPSLEQNSTSVRWYETFDDETLTKLIEKAFTQNYDVKQAIARVKQSEALMRQSGVASRPTIDAEVSWTKRFEDDRVRSTYEYAAMLAWEIDLFDRLSNIAKSDMMEKEARVEDLEALRLSLSAQIAEVYYGVIASHQTLTLLGEQVKLDKQYLALVQLRFDNGVGTSVEVLQQKGQLSASESLIPTVLASLRAYENRLDLLVGEMPDGFARVDTQMNLLDVPMPSAVGIPSDLLLHRPDLRAQKNRLVASDAGIAAAIAARLPSFTLGAGVYQSKSLVYDGSLTSFSASLIQPLLDWGARKAEVERNRALYEEALASFGSLYLSAVEEVENTLYSEARQREYLQRLENRRVILQATVEEAEAQYLQGISDYLPVLSALEALHEVERTLIEAKYQLINYRITLYKALGSTISLSSNPKELP